MGILRKGTGEHRDDEGLGSGPPPPKSIQVMATVALILTVGVCLFAIAYSAIVRQDDASVALLGTLATASVASLVILSGGRHGDNE